MSEMHSSPDRVVWFDLPVADLARASKFYGAVLGIKVEEAKAGNFTVLDSEGNRIALHSGTDQ
jgi:predicted enzyme related to lactoylglutathione lyase